MHNYPDRGQIVDLPRDPIEKAGRLVGPCCGHLGDAGRASRLVQNEDIREGPAHIDANHPGHGRTSFQVDP